MTSGAFLIPLAIQCLLGATPFPTPAERDPPPTPDPLPRFEPLESEPPDIAALRSQIAQYFASLPAATPPAAGGGPYPMRIYVCDAAGPLREVVTSPPLVVIHAGDR